MGIRTRVGELESRKRKMAIKGLGKLFQVKDAELEID